MQRKSEYLGEKVRILLQAGDNKAAQALAFEAVEIGSTPDKQVLIGMNTSF